MVDGWAEQNGYTVWFCTGNLGLRDLSEPLRETAGARILLVDRSRKDSDQPLFYPDLEAEFRAALAALSETPSAGQRQRASAAQPGPLELSLREFLVEAMHNPAWPTTSGIMGRVENKAFPDGRPASRLPSPNHLCGDGNLPQRRP